MSQNGKTQKLEWQNASTNGNTQVAMASASQKGKMPVKMAKKQSKWQNSKLQIKIAQHELKQQNTNQTSKI